MALSLTTRAALSLTALAALSLMTRARGFQPNCAREDPCLTKRAAASESGTRQCTKWISVTRTLCSATEDPVLCSRALELLTEQIHVAQLWAA